MLTRPNRFFNISLLRKIKPFHLFFGVLLLVVLIFVGSVWAKSFSKSVNWVGPQRLPEKVLKSALSQNYFSSSTHESLDIQQIKAFRVRGEKGNLYLINFNTEKLCGQAGCLYVAYTESGQAALRLLLDPNLPKGVDLFALSNSSRGGYPCLQIAQPTPKPLQVEKVQYCFESDSFVRINSTFLVVDQQ